MTCIQVTSGNPPPTHVIQPLSGGAYKTEAECLQACQEGACCEGTTCTIKPACQCQCTSGSCCGPDTFTNITGETGPKCRTESEAACAARGGTWRCGVPCRGVSYDAAAGYGLGSEICSSLDAAPSVSPVFKGVGTVCTPNPCDYCTGSCSPLPTHPVYLSMSISNFTGPTPRDFAINTTRQVERKLFFAGTETCWAYSYLLQNAGHQCPTPFGEQVIDGYLLVAGFSQNECRFFANYKDAAGQCHRYNIYWSMPLTDTYKNVLCQRLFPISGSVSSSGISFDYSINVNPLP